MNYEYQTADPSQYHLLREYAQYNRNHPTEAESLLWEYLRAGVLGVSFKRQHVIGDYIADFICLSQKLIIELDGAYHNTPKQELNDQQRTEWLENKGYCVIRFTNEELFSNIDKVLETIKDNLYE